MGIDFLEILFRLEKQLDIRCMDAPWEQVWQGRVPADVMAGEVAEVIDWIRQGRPPYAPASAQEQVAEAANGRQSRPVLAYYSHARLPPLTGKFRADTWKAVKEAIIVTVRAPPERVAPEAWLVRDLGMC